MRYLRTNTATRVSVGPFLDKTDGITPETGLTATNEKLTFVVDDAGVPTLVLDTTATASGGANDMVHITGDDAGMYDLELAAANVNYLGRAHLSITYATDHCPVFHEFMIIPANVYDAMILGSDILQVDVAQFGNSNLTSASGIPEVKVASIANGVIAAATFAANALDAVWSTAARTLTAISDSAGVTTLLSRLSATRAGYLDKLLYIAATTQGKCVVTFISGSDFSYDYYDDDGTTIRWTATCTTGGRASVVRS